MHQDSIITKLMALQNAICTCFSTTASIMPTIANIKDLMVNFYDKYMLTQEEWTLVILLQALVDGEYKWLCKPFVTMLMNKDTKLSSNNIIKGLKCKLRRLMPMSTEAHKRWHKLPDTRRRLLTTKER